MNGKSSKSTKKKKKGELTKEELSADISNSSSNPTFEQGIKLFEFGMYVEAIEVFTIYAMQGDLIARQYLARCYFRLEKYDFAYRHFLILSESKDPKMREYGLSLIALIEETRGDVNKAIKILQSLSPGSRNTLNLALMWWKKYKITGEEHAIFQAIKLVNRIDLDNNELLHIQQVTHLKALFHQANSDFYVSADLYQKALELSTPCLERGKILIDYGSLLIEQGQLDHAEKILMEALQLVQGKSEVQEALANKWIGMLFVIRKQFREAKPYLEKAIKILRDRELIRELAGITFLFSDIVKNKDFYEAAEYYYVGRIFEELSEEVNSRDEKLVDFFASSFHIPDNVNSGIG